MMSLQRILSPVALMLAMTLPAWAVKDYQNDPGPSADQSRQQWAEATKGENLALGKKVVFSAKPDYRLTADEQDASQLTDGKLSARKDDRIWFNRDAVGWTHASEGVNLLIDLGSPQPVGTVVARFLGGAEQGSLLYPKSIAVVGSDDGRTFYELASLQGVTAGEKELAEQEPSRYFYLPQEGKAVMHPFVLQVHRKTRYIGLRVAGKSGFVFTDEIAVMKDQQPAQAASLDGLKPFRFIIHGIAFEPRHDHLVITTNLPTPTHFTIIDTRPEAARKKPITFTIDLPRGVTVLKTNGGEAKRDSSAKDKNRWIFKDFYNVAKGRAGSAYFVLEDGATLAKDATATFSSDDPDSAANAITTPVLTAEIPTVGNDEDLDVSLAWFNESNPGQSFPNFFQAFRQMGFNTLATFPRYFTTPERKKELADFANAAHEKGFRVLYNESAFHVMVNKHRKAAEIYNQINGKQGKYPCPCYTGQYYQEEMQRIHDCAELVHPEFVFYDIELWYRSAVEAKKCDRCQAAFKKSGLKDFDQFILDQGTRMMKDLHNATAGTAPGGKNPISGLYNVHAARPIYQKTFDFNAIYPKYVQLAQPSLYVQGNVQRVHDTIRENYDKIHSRNIIPWLTTGTYGEFPPYRVEQMILESFINGARGITYYYSGDFDPMDYYYHARALKLLVPYQQLLKSGKRIEVSGDNQLLTYSAFGSDHQALVLVGNYTAAPDAKTKLTFGGKNVAGVRDVINNKDLTPEDLQALQVEPNQQRLLLVTFK